MTINQLLMPERVFGCDGLRCPRCDEESILGFYYLDPGDDRVHMHTHYVCQSWPRGGSRCGWHGWLVPEGDTRPRCTECERRVDPEWHEASGGLCGSCLAESGAMIKVVGRDGD
jgi:hypothetical protein